MRKLFTVLAAILLTATVWAQAPQKMSYQTVIRNSSNALVTLTEVGMRISILQGTSTGTVVYVETQSPTTNINGLVSIEIGGETGFDTINWANGPYFIKTETDPTGGTNYTITGTSQLLSVPYALHAKSAETFTGTITETDPSVPTGTAPGQMQYWNGNAWVTVAPGTEGQGLNFCGGIPTWGPCPVIVQEVTNPTTGKIWMDRNLGATLVAASSTDAPAYGDLYQWGRGTDGHQIRTSPTTSTLSGTDVPGHAYFILAPSSPYDWRSSQNDNLWQGVNGVNNPCPAGYRIPTEAEFEAERTSWGSNDPAGAFASPLKLPVAGYRNYSDGSLNSVGSFGFYWSSTVDGSSSRFLYFYSGPATMTSDRRPNGFSVRCIKD